MIEIQGLVPMLVTPFADDDEVDEGALRRLVQFQLDQGADGIAVLGLGGEGYAVTTDERGRIIRLVAEELAGSAPLVVGVASTGARLGVEQAVRAEQAGADCLMVLPPYLIKPDVRRLVEYYRAVAAAVHIPVMVQDVPDVGVPLDLDAYRALTAVPNVTHAKIETMPPAPKIATISSALGDDLTIIGGRGGHVLLDELAAGAAGTMPFCDITDLFREVLDLWGDDGEQAQRAFNRILPLLNFSAQSAGAGQAIAKEVLRLRGVLPNNRVRNPTTPLDDRTRTGLKRVLASVDLP